MQNNFQMIYSRDSSYSINLDEHVFDIVKFLFDSGE